LGNAIRYNNIEAVKLLGKRTDLKVSDADREMAKKNGIDLDSLLKPQPFAETTEKVVTETVTADVADADRYNEIFKKVFSA